GPSWSRAWKTSRPTRRPRPSSASTARPAGSASSRRTRLTIRSTPRAPSSRVASWPWSVCCADLRARRATRAFVRVVSGADQEGLEARQEAARQASPHRDSVGPAVHSLHLPPGVELSLAGVLAVRQDHLDRNEVAWQHLRDRLAQLAQS